MDALTIYRYYKARFQIEMHFQELQALIDPARDVGVDSRCIRIADICGVRKASRTAVV